MKDLYKLVLILGLIPAAGCKPEYTEPDQLNQAIMSYDAKSIQYILDRGADPDKSGNEYSDTPVNTAVNMFTVSNTPEKKKKAEEILKLILGYSGDINKRDSVSGGTMLHYAKDSETLRLLVESGADVNASDIKYGNTPLHTWILTFRSDLEMYRYLLEHGADVNKKNSSGKTVIDYANDKNMKYSKDGKVKELYDILHQYSLKK
ncbi:MAG: hypothetical protein CVV49_17350 [Spirochaetae bacterium HGW-Spirochaetae-5]|nr:MAG: hypothetical protein CVV49_17350 [Spirochaetae bacterium HGW-Spirochaetae-5]